MKNSIAHRSLLVAACFASLLGLSRVSAAEESKVPRSTIIAAKVEVAAPALVELAPGKPSKVARRVAEARVELEKKRAGLPRAALLAAIASVPELAVASR